MNSKIITIGSIAIIAASASALAKPNRSQMGERPNPEEAVVDIVAEFDANADNLMDVVELESAIIGMHEKRIARMKEIAAERGTDAERPRRRGPDSEREAPNPSEIASRLVEDFDDNGDSVLDTEELMGALRALHSRGPGKGGPRGHGRKGGSFSDDESVE